MKHNRKRVGGEMSGDAILAGEAGAIDETKAAGGDGIFGEECSDSAAAGFPRTGNVVTLCGFESTAEDFAEGFGEEILAVFVEAKEEVFHRRFVDGDQSGLGKEGGIEGFGATSGTADLQAARGEVRSHRIDKKRARIDDGFAFQIGWTRGCAGDRVK